MYSTDKYTVYFIVAIKHFSVKVNEAPMQTSSYDNAKIYDRLWEAIYMTYIADRLGLKK